MHKKQLPFLWKLTWQNIVDFLPDAAFVIDKNKEVVGWNHGMEEMTGVKKEDILGKGNYAYSIPFYGNRRPIMIDLVENPNEEIEKKYKYIKRSGNALSAEVYIPTIFGGKGAFLWAKAWAIYDKKKKFMGAFEIIRDISEHKKTEAILRKDKEIFEEMVKEKTRQLLETQRQLVESKHLSDLGSLAAVVGHELRNPLGVIRIAAYNIRRKTANSSLSKGISSHLDNIEKKIMESDQIINNLLFYSKIKTPHIGKIKIFALLHECVIETKKRFSNMKVKIIEDYSSLRNKVIDADSVQIREVFSNILCNAFDAIMNENGRIEIIGVYNKDNNEIAVEIKDNGVGISDLEIGHIFTPFFSTKPKGTGLGLVVSKQIISLHKGRIEFASKKGAGSSFTVFLPIYQDNFQVEKSQ